MSDTTLSFDQFKKEVLKDYYTAVLSREISLFAHLKGLYNHSTSELFGIGKEIVQLAVSKQFEQGDWRSDSFCDITFLLASGVVTPKIIFEQLFLQLSYGQTFNDASRALHLVVNSPDDEKKEAGEIQYSRKNVLPTSGRRLDVAFRSLGLALGTNIYRRSLVEKKGKKKDNYRQEVVFVTFGNDSLSENRLLEFVNSDFLKDVPLVISMWDDYEQNLTAKSYSLIGMSNVVEYFKNFFKPKIGASTLKARGWSYAELCQKYSEAVALSRKEQSAVLLHVDELFLPSKQVRDALKKGVKLKEFSKWEDQYDPILKMRKWILDTSIVSEEELEKINQKAIADVRIAYDAAFQEYIAPVKNESNELIALLDTNGCGCASITRHRLEQVKSKLTRSFNPNRREVLNAARFVLYNICSDCDQNNVLSNRVRKWMHAYCERYFETSYIEFNEELKTAASEIPCLPPLYDEINLTISGAEVLLNNFDALLNTEEQILFIEGKARYVPDNFYLPEKLQSKYGNHRVFNTQSSETTLVDFAVGLALRGLFPIVNISSFHAFISVLHYYSDEISVYSNQIKNRQKISVIVRTHGGVIHDSLHSNLSMGALLHSVRDIYVCVPRDMTRAAGFYNALVAANHSGIVVEPIDGYVLDEPKAINYGEYTTPLGVVDILKNGGDVTLLTYGSSVNVCINAVNILRTKGIYVELIDVQTLVPFDIYQTIKASIRKTKRLVLMDIDLSGGATSFIMQQVFGVQDAFSLLSDPVVTITAKKYFSATVVERNDFYVPTAEDVCETICEMMHRSNPAKFSTCCK